MILKFSIKNQIISRTDCNRIVADSHNYLYADFEFTEDWGSVQKTAIFTNNNAEGEAKTYEVPLTDNSCLVPWEVLVAGDLIVSVWGGDRITANQIYVTVEPSGLIDGEAPQPPTPGVYDIIMEKLEALQSYTGQTLRIDVVDANDCEEGIIFADLGSVNVPESGFAGILSTIIRDDNVSVQVAVGINGVMYSRSKTASWGGWKNASVTVVDDLISEDSTVALSANQGRVLKSYIDIISNAVDDIYVLIPNTASLSNQLADKAFVNSTVGTNTAIFRGTFNSVAELEAYSGEKTNNDYAFVVSTDAEGNTLYNRYKYNGLAWVYEFSLNNSSFTADQWAAINSGISDVKVEEFNGKYKKPQGGIPPSDMEQIVQTALSSVPVIAGNLAQVQAKIPAEASQFNKLVDKEYVDGLVGNIETALTALDTGGGV